MKHQENLKKVLRDAESKWEEQLEEVSTDRNKLKDYNLQLNQKVIEHIYF